MRQALHIFRKDVRCLRREILLLLVLAALLGWAETHLGGAAGVAELLVVMAVNYVIARVVHAEAIPGHNQFWITRPYRRNSLLGAKALFVLAFVNLPVFAAQCYMILAEHFSFGASLPGLIWSQALMILCVSLPATCLASLTAGLMPFLLAEFIVVGAVFILEAILIRSQAAGPVAVGWVRDSVVLAIMSCLGIYVLHRQYKTRQTEIGSKWAIGGAAAAAIVFLFLPWTFALGIQSKLSEQGFDASALNAGLASVVKSVFPPPVRGRNPSTAGRVSLPISIKGIHDGRELEADALSITLIGADGRTWSSGYVPPIMIEPGSADNAAGNVGESLIVGNLQVDPAFFAAESTRPVTMRARIYLTVFGDPHSMTIPVQPEPVNAIDGLECFAGLFNQLYCQSIFRWPRRRVYAEVGEGGVKSYIRAVSYSPFPATLGFDPIEQHSFSGPSSATRATITTKAPLSHFQMEAEIPGVSLTEFTAEAKRKAMMAPPLPGTTSRSGTR